MSNATLIERAVHNFQYGNFQASTFDALGKVVLIPWHSEEGRQRLFTSDYANSFFRLANFYQPQINPLYCGVASAVIVLNALSQPKDAAPNQMQLQAHVPDTEPEKFIPYCAYSQLTFLNQSTEHIKPKAVIEYRQKNAAGDYRPGLRLDELQALIASYGAKVEMQFAGELEEEQGINAFRKLMQKVLAGEDSFVIIHFRCDLMGGIPRGHISPVAAYHHKSDSLLILDVAGHKTPWYWAPLPEIFKAMSFKYDSQPRGGGYLSVSV